MSALEETAFSDLMRASFDGVEFPYSEITTIGSIRDYIHEFPHTPTGKPEKMGRKNYEFRMKCPFLAGLPDYPDLWPDRLYSIRTKFELERTAYLHVPTFGTIKAYIRSIDIETSAHVLSGEQVSIVFIEDDNADGIIFDQLTAIGPVSIDAQLGQVESKYQDVVVLQTDNGNGSVEDEAQIQNVGSILTALDETVTAVISVRDQVDVYGNLLEAKLLRAAAQCDALDKALTFNGGFSQVIDANLALWSTLLGSLTDIKNTHSDLVVYVTPRAMTITGLSIALYNDTSHTTELLQINAVDDPLNIPPNTRIKYYPGD